MATGKNLPTELRKEAKEIGKDLPFDEAQAGMRLLYFLCIHAKKNFFQSEPTTHVDSEYARAGSLDPKIVITTSRDPSSKLLQFSKVCLSYTN